ncbi:T9SS type A sorting domain-containing protein [Lutimonas zeaxanthinifaciens]|uniref:T9SS type A sorting domain-containing protein n=1 Tax=Lutimonas zeaxanthinifaciens TaxID=3060215 RepID=UPI00265CE91C|nr:T9SS type A sorting domain-containing protein [Lutimonas sp. YSD2104]WKK66351.1 T9SS type A sorting domain-containing protein [Lutimonas sp. YSD2104]
MKKNYFLIILILTFSVNSFGQISQKKQERTHHFSNHSIRGNFQRINNIERISRFNVNNKYKSSLRYKGEKKEKLDSVVLTDNGYEAKSEFFYYSNGYLSKEIRSDRENSNIWDVYSIDEFTYDTNGNIASIVELDWNTTTNQWDNEIKSEYNYDSNGDLVQIIEWDWDTATNLWDIGYKTEYSYNTNGTLVQEFGYRWENSTNQWESTSKRKYQPTYDNNGNLTQLLVIRLNNSTNEWENSFKEEYSYDTQGFLINYFLYEWKKQDDQWLVWDKEEYNYDSNGDLLQITDWDWDDSTNQFILYNKDEFAYDISFSVSELVVPYYYYLSSEFQEKIYSFKHKVIKNSDYNWDSTSNEWVDDGFWDFYYSDYSDPNSDNMVLTTGLANPNTNIQIKQIITDAGFTIHNEDISNINESLMTGKKVLALFNGGQTWNGTQLFSNSQANEIVDFVEKGGSLYISSRKGYNNVLSQFGVTVSGNDGGNSGFDWPLIRLNATKFVSHPITENLFSIEGDVGANFLVDGNWSIIGEEDDGSDLLAVRNFGSGKIVLWYGQRSFRDPGSTNNAYETDISQVDNAIFFSNIFNFFSSSTLGVDTQEIISFDIYPNPVSSILTIDSKLAITKVELYSVLGKRVKLVNSDFKSIQTDNLSKGIYLVNIHTEKGIESRKLIKQ